jgi:hypothetical protein
MHAWLQPSWINADVKFFACRGQQTLVRCLYPPGGGGQSRTQLKFNLVKKKKRMKKDEKG